MSEVLESLSQTTQQPTEPGDYALVAKLRNVRPLVHLLKAINFKERAQCVITQRGVKFSVEDSRSVQAHAYLQRHFFQHFVFGQGALVHGNAQPEQDQDLEMAFAVQLSTLLQCLTIFAGTPGSATMSNPSHAGHSLANHYEGMGGSGGSNTGVGGTGGSSSTYRSYTSLGWVVNSQGSEVELVLEENEVISVCKLVTLSPEDMANFQFSAYPTVHRLIMRSETLRDALLELDGTSEKVVFQFSPSVPHFSLVTMGANGSTEVNFSKDAEIIESFYCAKAQHIEYHFSQVQHALNALVYSTKTSIRINERGFLSMQFMIPADHTDSCFVELLCAPLETMD